MVVLPWSVMSVGILIMIVLLGILFVWRMSRELRSGFPLRDERTQMVTGKAATYAFYIGSYFMIALMLMDILNREFQGAPLLDAGYALVISLLVQNLTFIGLRLYFNRIGDF